MALKNTSYMGLFLILLAFCSCSSNKDFSKVRDIFYYYQNHNSEKPIKIFTRNEIENFDYEIIEIKTNGIIRQALMLPISKRYGYTNYITGLGQTINTQGSLISKTNGMNINLLSVETVPNPFIIQRKKDEWPNFLKRTYSFLSPLNSTIHITLECKISIGGLEDILIIDLNLKLFKIKENCSGEQYEFQNLYWLDDEGFIWKSKQWISPENIFAELLVLQKDPKL